MMKKNSDMAEWYAEIEIVQIQITRWLQKQDDADVFIQALKRVPVQDSMMLGVEDTLWRYINWGLCSSQPEEFDEVLEGSDIWQCAVAGALTAFQKE